MRRMSSFEGHPCNCDVRSLVQAVESPETGPMNDDMCPYPEQENVYTANTITSVPFKYRHNRNIAAHFWYPACS